MVLLDGERERERESKCVCVCVCVCVCMCVCIYIYIYVCVCVCVCVEGPAVIKCTRIDTIFFGSDAQRLKMYSDRPA